MIQNPYAIPWNTVWHPYCIPWNIKCHPYHMDTIQYYIVPYKKSWVDEWSSG